MAELTDEELKAYVKVRDHLKELREFCRLGHGEGGDAEVRKDAKAMLGRFKARLDEFEWWGPATKGSE